ncbi:MAG: sulfurtransferase [Actinobacteria bacterium]|nr:sulfurtransferase [Actinomycetota bacterium]
MAAYANPNALVETDWVAQHGRDAGLRLVEVDVDTASYDTGHVAGAVGWNWQTQLSDQLRRDIASRDQWAALLGASGVSNGTKVVLYGDNNNWFAAFAYWLFKLYGHRDVALMNGGKVKWAKEGRPLVTDPPAITPATYAAASPDVSLRARQRDVEGVMGRAGSVLIDVRSPAEFRGEVLAPPGLPETAQRAGHIPGAQSVPWASSVNPDTGAFKPVDELRQIYGGKGASADQDVIAYCRIGERSSHTWFVLKELLGLPKVRNYDGSWTEWGSMIGVPIEK